jgi:hypothetical protein
MTDAVASAHSLVLEGRNGEAEEVLRNAADDREDVLADRELGRLMSLWRPASPLDPDDPWEAEIRLARSAGDDLAATCALLNLYVLAAAEVRKEYLADSFDPDEKEKAGRSAHYRDLAVGQCERALALDPAGATAPSAMVSLLYDEWEWLQSADMDDDGRLASSLLELKAAAERVVAIDPGDTVAVAALAEVSMELDDTAAARHWSHRLLELDPGDLESQEFLRRIGEPVPEPDGQAGYGYLCLMVEALGEKHGDRFEEQIIVSNAVDLLWAAPRIAMLDAGLDHEPADLVLYEEGRFVNAWSQPLGADLLEWLRQVVRDPEGPLLPHGRPVWSPTIDRFGYSATGG